jgi:hypothetical protein
MCLERICVDAVVLAIRRVAKVLKTILVTSVYRSASCSGSLRVEAAHVRPMCGAFSLFSCLFIVATFS